MLEDIRKKVGTGETRLGDALAKALPLFRGRASDERLMWLSNELQGYANALNFYQKPSDDFPPYRVVTGKLRLMDHNGNLSDIRHPMAERSQFFLAAPLAWLEDSAQLPGLTTYVELPELNVYTDTKIGSAVCEVTKEQIVRVLNSFKQSFVVLIDQVCESKTSHR